MNKEMNSHAGMEVSSAYQNLEGLVNSVLALPTVDLLKFIELLQKKTGIDASQISMGGAAAAQSDNADAAPVEVKKNLYLTGLSDASAKMKVITKIKNLFGLNLVEAKKLVDETTATAGTKKLLKEKVTPAEVNDMMKELSAEGATVILE